MGKKRIRNPASSWDLSTVRLRGGSYVGQWSFIGGQRRDVNGHHEHFVHLTEPAAYRPRVRTGPCPAPCPTAAGSVLMSDHGRRKGAAWSSLCHCCPDRLQDVVQPVAGMDLDQGAAALFTDPFLPKIPVHLCLEGFARRELPACQRIRQGTTATQWTGSIPGGPAQTTRLLSAAAGSNYSAEVRRPK